LAGQIAKKTGLSGQKPDTLQPYYLAAIHQCYRQTGQTDNGLVVYDEPCYNRSPQNGAPKWTIFSSICSTWGYSSV